MVSAMLNGSDEPSMSMDARWFGRRGRMGYRAFKYRHLPSMHTPMYYKGVDLACMSSEPTYGLMIITGQ